MDELKQRFDELDEIEAPDVWGDGSMRTPRTLAGTPSLDRRPRQRVTAAVVAFAVFIAAGAFALSVFERTSGLQTPEPSVSIDPLASILVGWTQLPAPPAVLSGAANVWTGRELLVWGGSSMKSENYEPSAEGFAFDPATGSWSNMPSAPIPGKFTEAVWTGTEAVFLGVGTDASAWQGEAFDPATATWRVIAPPPFESRPAVVVWTGTDIIGWGGGKPGEPSNVSGAAYDPVADSWLPIADAPIGMNAASGTWTGAEMLVFGSLLDGGNHAATRNAVGEIYDPVADSWREMAPSDLSPQASAAVWVGDRMVAYDYGWDAAEYDVATDTWHRLDGLLFKSAECYPDGALVGRAVFAFGCGEAATWMPGEQTWTPVRGGLTGATVEAHDKQYQLWRFASLIPAGDVLFLAAEGLTVSNEGAPCYGCPGSPISYWAYRPAELGSQPSPTVSRTPALSRVALPGGLSAMRLAIGEGIVWALASNDQTRSTVLLRIDPATDQVVATIPLEAEPWYLAPGGEAVWVGSPRSSGLQRVDVATNEVTAQIQLPGDGVSAIAADDQDVWVEVTKDRSDQDQANLVTLVRIDAQTSAVVATIPLDGLSGYDDEVVIGADAVWVAGVNLTEPSEERGADLIRIDTSTNSISAVIPTFAFSVRAGADSIWVTSPADGVNDSLRKPETWVAHEIDPTTNVVSAPIPLPDAASAVLAVTDDGVWFSGYDDQGLIHPVRLQGGAFDSSVPSINSVYSDVVFDEFSGTIWVAAVSGLKRIDLDGGH